MRGPRPLLKDHYTLLKKVGSGTYGEVFKASAIGDPTKIVSVKQSKQTKNGNDDKLIPPAVLRELTLLSEINFPHIIHTSIKDVFYDSDNHVLAFVYDYGAFDVRKLIRFYLSRKQIVSEMVTKSILFQLLLALDHIHQRGIIHCDITPPNLIIMPENSKIPGIVKLIDFGLARAIDNTNFPKNTGVVTVWYRAPELLLGDSHYDASIDLWSAGCIFAELLLGDVLFKAETQNEQNPTGFNKNQLAKILEIMGPINESSIARPEWCAHLADYNRMTKPKQKTSLQKLFQNVNPKAFDLLIKMLEYNPYHRITAHDALRHEYFNEKPIPGMNISRMILREDWVQLVSIGEGSSTTI
ncbi:CMGC family protein kinase [Trichomonas vaginalis G3]|uniref:CMGC family protein kinase n=1 Tax=Trichomonas vaginalis (strain ATCC PRA-98 / G3) TaxID=412133 RepID=A2EJY1_TRIV3|nr:RNA polymerase II CTD heptapeptide repeat kinase protein [Trichomonas vaginalis G3]EAY07049.1 CMGC family protein kinase [Trichomonas vaginalis G3]KAI5529555.1 RNA polymerase II CTD heptapeptide repeat kinase protein [Trichomonas vaginalis G3]|eukprot:XP_001319272.1 CMGC family protein kinase [Trichomonas vaginalis G3]